jgi:hypothetical protein
VGRRTTVILVSKIQEGGRGARCYVTYPFAP